MKLFFKSKLKYFKYNFQKKNYFIEIFYTIDKIIFPILIPMYKIESIQDRKKEFYMEK